MVGLSGHPYKTPQDPGREAESPGSGLPLHKYRRGRGSSKELSQRLSSQRNSFQGNVSLSPSTEEPLLSTLTLDRQTSFPNTVCFVSLLHLCAQTLLWEDQARPGQHTHSVLLQSKHPLKRYRTRWWCCSPGLKSNAAIFQANTEHSPVSLYCMSVRKLQSFQAKKKKEKSMRWLKIIQSFFLLLLLSFHKLKKKQLTTFYGHNAIMWHVHFLWQNTSPKCTKKHTCDGNNVDSGFQISTMSYAIISSFVCQDLTGFKE